LVRHQKQQAYYGESKRNLGRGGEAEMLKEKAPTEDGWGEEMNKQIILIF
jgi:hypothetical protein